MALRAISQGVSALPTPYLRQVEMIARVAQGKGWGAGTVQAEVAAALSLTPGTHRGAPLVLDVGANAGSWTAALLEAAPDAAVVAFEPSSTAFKRLANRHAGDSRVTIVQTAVGRSTGKAMLWADAPGSPLGSLSKRRLDHFSIDFSHSESVPVVTLDSWQEEAGLQPVVLKMDVEGHELDVLAGATRLLEGVEVIQFEFGGCNIDTRTYFQDFFYFFQDAGFAVFRLGPRGMERIARYSERDEAFETTNYFAQRKTGLGGSTA